ATRVACRLGVEIVSGEEFVQHLLATADKPPGVLQTRIEAEGNAGRKGEGRVLAPVVIKRGLAHLDGSVSHFVHHLQGREQLAAREWLNLELPVGSFGEILCDRFSAAIDRVEALWKARRHAPFELRHRLCNRGCGKRRCRRSCYTRRCNEFSAVHSVIPS